MCDNGRTNQITFFTNLAYRYVGHAQPGLMCQHINSSVMSSASTFLRKFRVVFRSYRKKSNFGKSGTLQEIFIFYFGLRNHPLQ